MQLVTKIFTLNNDGWLAADNFKDNAQFTMANLQENNELYCLQNPNKHPILPMKDMKHTDQVRKISIEIYEKLTLTTLILEREEEFTIKQCHKQSNGFCVTSFRTFLRTPYLPYISGQYWWAGRN